ncbi:MAG: SGNH/GDSL hydrolase family protein [Proteobacteria bacterium]|nr:SGNH/GDSL hydrolase family protein [Pseudomonadota bacterium]
MEVRPPRSKIASATQNALLVLAALLVSLCIIEIGARLYYAGAGAPHWTHLDFRLTRPTPYRDSPYFSAAFLHESFQQPDGYFVVAGTRIVLPAEYVGRWFNVSGSRRITSDVPRGTRRRVLLFGGSTVYCSEVPDNLTLASHLQRRLSQAAPGEFRVENYGVTSVGAAQQLERLRTLAFTADDFVVFYDGVNDLYNGVLFGQPDGWIVGENRDSLSSLPGWQARLLRASLWLSERFDMFRPLAYGVNFVEPPRVTDPATLAANVARTGIRYREVQQEAAAFVRSRGATFIHFLQPNLFASPALTAYEAGLLEMPLVVVPGTAAAFRHGLPALRAAVAGLQGDGIASFDLSAALIARPGADVEYYLDAMHVAEGGNDVLSGLIAERLLAQMK